MLGIFKSGDPEKRARAIVHAVAHFRDGKKLAEVSYGCTSVIIDHCDDDYNHDGSDDDDDNCEMLMIAVVLMLHLLSIHMMI